MSYKQAMKHWHNHRKDKFTQPMGWAAKPTQQTKTVVVHLTTNGADRLCGIDTPSPTFAIHVTYANQAIGIGLSEGEGRLCVDCERIYLANK